MHISTAGRQTICIPVASEAYYQPLIGNGHTFRCFLDHRIAEHPELFPAEIANLTFPVIFLGGAIAPDPAVPKPDSLIAYCH